MKKIIVALLILMTVGTAWAMGPQEYPVTSTEESVEAKLIMALTIIEECVCGNSICIRERIIICLLNLLSMFSCTKSKRDDR